MRFCQLLPWSFRHWFAQLSYAVKSGKEILKSINVKIEPGTVTALMGPSGAYAPFFVRVLTPNVLRS